MNRYTVTEYERHTYWTGSGGRIVRENERDTFTGTAAEVARYLADEIRDNYQSEADYFHEAARDTGQPDPFQMAREIETDMERHAADGPAELIQGADEGTPEEIGMDPEPRIYATVRKVEPGE
jgi:hypothetical protein